MTKGTDCVPGGLPPGEVTTLIVRDPRNVTLTVKTSEVEAPTASIRMAPLPLTAGEVARTVKVAVPVEATVCVNGEIVTPAGMLADCTVKVTDPVKLPNGCTVVVALATENGLLMSTVTKRVIGLRENAAGPMA